MTTEKVSISEAKAKLGELVKRVAYGDERIVLEVRSKPQAVLVPLRDLDKLEATESAMTRKMALEKLRELRTRTSKRTGTMPDAASDVREIRDERSSRY